MTAASALRDAGYHLLEAPSFGVIHSVLAGVLMAIAVAVGVAIPTLLPGVLAVLEVVNFEERSGVGAAAVVRGYQGDPVLEADETDDETGPVGASSSDAERGEGRKRA